MATADAATDLALLDPALKLHRNLSRPQGDHANKLSSRDNKIKHRLAIRAARFGPEADFQFTVVNDI